MPVHFGKDARLYYNAGTHASPSWTAINSVRDVTVPDGEYNSVPATGRDSPIETEEPVLLKISVDFKIRTNEDDPTFVVLESAFLNKTKLDIMVLSGPSDVTGNRGFRFDAKVHKFFGEDQNIDQMLWRPANLKPCVPTDQPQSVIVTGGSPVYTNLS